MDPALPARVTMSHHLHRGRTVMQIVRIGLDLAKYVFEIHGVDAYGKTVVRKTLPRALSQQRDLPAPRQGRRDRPGDGDRPDSGGLRPKPPSKRGCGPGAGWACFHPAIY